MVVHEAEGHPPAPPLTKFSGEGCGFLVSESCIQTSVTATGGRAAGWACFADASCGISLGGGGGAMKAG